MGCTDGNSNDYARKSDLPERSQKAMKVPYQSCEMSQIWQIYLCKDWFERFDLCKIIDISQLWVCCLGKVLKKTIFDLSLSLLDKRENNDCESGLAKSFK